ncbi:hypothetical protein PAMA_013491 [Pampus argenteus]
MKARLDQALRSALLWFEPLQSLVLRSAQRNAHYLVAACLSELLDSCRAAPARCPISHHTDIHIPSHRVFDGGRPPPTASAGMQAASRLMLRLTTAVMQLSLQKGVCSPAHELTHIAGKLLPSSQSSQSAEAWTAAMTEWVLTPSVVNWITNHKSFETVSWLRSVGQQDEELRELPGELGLGSDAGGKGHGEHECRTTTQC